ncbi:histidine kinase [Phormidium willei BDU 130791]|nr:histidine kinase [Phormidium willei BDU 130791]
MSNIRRLIERYENLSRVLLIAIVYSLVALLGMQLAVLPGDVATVWIPAGFSLAVTLLWGPQVWPGILIGAFSTYPILDPSPVHLAIGVVTATGNTLTALIGAHLVQRVTHRPYPLHHTNHVFLFIIWGGLISQLISATFGVTALWVAQWIRSSEFGYVFLTWWIANVTGVIIYAPCLLVWFTPSQSRNIKVIKNFVRQNFLEILAWLILATIVIKFAFFEQAPIEYLMMPLLVWAVFRFPVTWTTSALVLTTSLAVIGTVQRRSIFVRDNLNASLLFLNSFIAVISIAVLVLIAILNERTQAIFALKKAKQDLEIRVKERTQELSDANQQLEQQQLYLKQQAGSLTDALSQLKQTQAQLIQNETMTGLGQLVAGVAHEINNPIGFIHSNLTPAQEYFEDILKLLLLYQAKTPKPDPEILEFMEEIDFEFLQEDFLKLMTSMRSGSERIQRIVLSLRNFSRLDEAELKAVDIHDGLDSTLLVLQHRLRDPGSQSSIQVVKHYGQLPKVECFAIYINQVFMNILNNAIDGILTRQQTETTPMPGIIQLETRLFNDSLVQILISDNGIGIKPEHQTRIFEPFFTTKDVGQGTGLGLYNSYETIVTQHGGSLVCDSTPNQGTRFEITLPIGK